MIGLLRNKYDNALVQPIDLTGDQARDQTKDQARDQLLNPSDDVKEGFTADEEQLISLIYRFANKEDEWFNLLLSLSNSISIAGSLPANHPYQDISQRVLAHLRNAIKISSKLNASAKYNNADSVLNHIPMGVGIIDHMGRIIEINQEAETLITHSDHWRIENNYLIAQHLNLAEKFFSSDSPSEQHISLAFSHKTVPGVSKETVKTDEILHLTRIPTTNKSPETNLAHSPEHSSEHSPSKSYDSNDAKLFYFCIPRANSELINTKSLTNNFKLTETEALVVSTLVKEVSSKKTAKKLKLKETTIRSHLTSIYLKMDVKRKPELIRKVLIHSLVKQEPLPFSSDQLQLLRKSTQKTQFIHLRDGRKLSYIDHQTHSKSASTSSTSATETIMIMHNVMGSAFEIPPGNEALLNTENIRIIIPERPGYGNSDPHENRTHEDFCKDVEELLDQLKIDTVKVMAHSIGGAYALALAEFLPQRIERIAMVNAFTRLEDLRNTKPVPVLVSAVLQSIRFAPFLIEPVLRMAVGKSIEQFYEQQLKLIRPKAEGLAADINLLKAERYRQYAIANLKQSAKQGISTWSDEINLSFSDWKFEVSNKKIEYQFWHGDHDDVIQVGAVEKLSKDVNTLHFYHYRNETHFLFSRHFSEVVEQLISPTPLKNKQLKSIIL